MKETVQNKLHNDQKKRNYEFQNQNNYCQEILLKSTEFKFSISASKN